jgi:hypothetical protein
MTITHSFQEDVNIRFRGFAFRLDLHVHAFGGNRPLVMEFDGAEVDNLSLSGDHAGDIVLGGSGQVGNIETGDGMEDNQKLHIEGELEVGSVNGQPATPPSAPSGSSPGSSTPSPPPAPKVYHPSVTHLSIHVRRSVFRRAGCFFKGHFIDWR